MRAPYCDLFDTSDGLLNWCPPFKGVRYSYVRTNIRTYYVVGHVRTVKYYLLDCVNVVVHSFYMLLKCTR